MRKSDENKDHKSYIVVKDSLKQALVVKGEFWQPGYTKAHQPTPVQAVQYEIDKIRKDKVELERRSSELYKLRSALENSNG